MWFRQLFDRESSTYTYLLACPRTREALILDPVREQLERDTRLLRELGFRLTWIAETHVHADHVTSADALRAATGARTAVSARSGAACADRPLRHGDWLQVGDHKLEVRATPGHTDGCLSFVTEDLSRVFTGDALLIRGCGRTDFQQGDASTLWRSVKEQLFTLPDHCQVYPAHDYRGQTCSTIGEEKALNPRLGGDATEESFRLLMSNLNLAQPAKIHEAVPANLACGRPNP